MQVMVAIASLKDPQWMILLKSLDAIKTTITAQASDLRPGHHCIVKMPDNINPIYEDDMWGGINVRFPIVFDDGIRWLIRVHQMRHEHTSRSIGGACHTQ